MYLKHFGLATQPFRLTPDIGFLFMSKAHGRAKSYMDYAVWNREGFVVITGEIGCGKTTLLQKFLADLNEQVLVAKVFQTQLDDVEFLQAVLVEFGLNPFNARKVELLDMLNSFLIEQFQQKRQIVLVVDDAHNLGLKVLEEIRMLAGLETRKEKILQVILIGQPQLRETLDLPEMEQLAQRVKLRFHIPALSPEEVADYVRFRLGIAGAKSVDLFPPVCLPAIYKYTGGIPRLVNTLCDTVLTCAFADGISEITAACIEAAVEELQWPPYSERVERRRAHASRPEEGGLNAMWSEQAETLARIAENTRGLDELAAVMSSMKKVLAALEVRLRSEGASSAALPHSSSASDRREKAS